MVYGILVCLWILSCWQIFNLLLLNFDEISMAGETCGAEHEMHYTRNFAWCDAPHNDNHTNSSLLRVQFAYFVCKLDVALLGNNLCVGMRPICGIRYYRVGCIHIYIYRPDLTPSIGYLYFFVFLFSSNAKALKMVFFFLLFLGGDRIEKTFGRNSPAGISKICPTYGPRYGFRTLSRYGS